MYFIPNDMTEREYDDIMSEARRIFERQESYGDPYSFHKAFEYDLQEYFDRFCFNYWR